MNKKILTAVIGVVVVAVLGGLVYYFQGGNLQGFMKFSNKKGLPIPTFSQTCSTHGFYGIDDGYVVELLDKQTNQRSTRCNAEYWEITGDTSAINSIIMYAQEVMFTRLSDGNINVRARKGEQWTDNNYLVIKGPTPPLTGSASSGSSGGASGGSAGGSGGGSSESQNLRLGPLDYEIGYSLASPSSFNEGLVFNASVPATFTGKTGYIYINDKRLNIDPVIYESNLALNQDTWTLLTNSQVIRYIVSPGNLRSVFNNGITSSVRLSLPLAKITIKFCDQNNYCYENNFQNLSPYDLTVGDF